MVYNKKKRDTRENFLHTVINHCVRHERSLNLTHSVLSCYAKKRKRRKKLDCRLHGNFFLELFTIDCAYRHKNNQYIG